MEYCYTVIHEIFLDRDIAILANKVNGNKEDINEACTEDFGKFVIPTLETFKEVVRNKKNARESKVTQAEFEEEMNNPFWS